MGLTGIFGGKRGRLLETGQTTCYHVGDDGDYEAGLGKAYTILTTGGYSGTSNLDVPSYAAATIAFAATTPGTITDTANGLAHILTGDTIVVKGSASNDGTYAVSTGGVAGTVRTTEATVLEAAGAYVKLYKRAAHSNNAVLDRHTGLMWSRYTSNAERVGAASTGTLNWYDAATCFTLHPAGADLQMIAAPTNTLRIVGGAGEVARYDVGDIIVCSGFANAVNNLPGYYVVSVTVNGADLDIVLDPVNNVLVAEAAGGARDIKLVCRSIFGYAAAARAASLGGHTDWRVPADIELVNLRNTEVATAVPDAVAFPGWPTTAAVWTATTCPAPPTNAMQVLFAYGRLDRSGKTTSTFFVTVLRGGA
jgi:hypothetical protein